VLVVDGELPLVLISDITFICKGVVLIQDDRRLLGIAGDQIVLQGVRDPEAPRQSASAMWRLDLRALLQALDPRLHLHATTQTLIRSTQDILDVWEPQAPHGLVCSGWDVITSCGAQPTCKVQNPYGAPNSSRLWECLGLCLSEYDRAQRTEGHRLKGNTQAF
jgi:hypothetical protein